MWDVSTMTDGTSARVALVTGATSGLGRAVAGRLAAAGFHVAVLGRHEEDLQTTAEQVRSHGVLAMPLVVDLADTDGLAAVVEGIEGQLGAVSVLVNAAGTDAPGPAEGLSLHDWERVMAVNLTAPFALARAVMPQMRRGGDGLIVNVSSVAGRRGWANASAYCSSKFALTGLTQSLAAEGREAGVRACVIYPGAMRTNWGTFEPQDRDGAAARQSNDDEALDPDVVADLIAWMATAPGRPVLNEVTMTPLLEGGWP